MNSGARILPIGQSPSLTERLFWPAAALAVLALGGFVYLFYLMFGSHGGSREVERPAAQVQQKVEPSKPVETQTPVAADANPAPAAPGPMEKPAAAEPEKSETAGAPSQPEPTETAMVKPPPEKPDVDPYAVPSNKPYLSHDMFQPKGQAPANAAKPKTPAPAAAATAKTPEKPKTPAAPTSVASAARPDDKLTTQFVSPVHGKIYVLKDGRRISAVSTVDLGDSYGVKDLNSSYLTIPKTDVSEVIGR